MILALRTDKPEAELYLLDDDGAFAEYKWAAHRQLSVDLLVKIEELLNENSKDKSDINSIVVFEGPGSFTGLRIGITVANAMADGLEVDIVATNGDSWLTDGQHKLINGEGTTMVLPVYGGEANITQPRK